MKLLQVVLIFSFYHIEVLLDNLLDGWPIDDTDIQIFYNAMSKQIYFH